MNNSLKSADNPLSVTQLSLNDCLNARRKAQGSPSTEVTFLFEPVPSNLAPEADASPRNVPDSGHNTVGVTPQGFMVVDP